MTLTPRTSKQLHLTRPSSRIEMRTHLKWSHLRFWRSHEPSNIVLKIRTIDNVDRRNTLKE